MYVHCGPYVCTVCEARIACRYKTGRANGLSTLTEPNGPSAESAQRAPGKLPPLIPVVAAETIARHRVGVKVSGRASVRVRFNHKYGKV